MKPFDKIAVYITAVFNMAAIIFKPLFIIIFFGLLSLSPPLFIAGCLALLLSDNKPKK